MRRKWQTAFGLAAFNDFLDISGIGSVPVMGTLLDLATSALLWRTIGRKRTLPTILEFIPGINVLPIYTFTVAGSYYAEEKMTDQGMRRIEIS